MTETDTVRPGIKKNEHLNKQTHAYSVKATNKQKRETFFLMQVSHWALHMWVLHKLVNTLLFPSRAIRSIPLKARGWMRAKRQIAQLIAVFQHSVWPWSDYSENKNLDIKIWFPRQGRGKCTTELKLPSSIVHFCHINKRSRPLFGE